METNMNILYTNMVYKKKKYVVNDAKYINNVE